MIRYSFVYRILSSSLNQIHLLDLPMHAFIKLLISLDQVQRQEQVKWDISLTLEEVEYTYILTVTSTKQSTLKVWTPEPEKLYEQNIFSQV